MVGAPFSLRGGGFGPLFIHFIPLWGKKGIPAEFFKKQVPAESSKGVPAKAYGTKIQTEKTDTGYTWYRSNTNTEKMTGTTAHYYVSTRYHKYAVWNYHKGNRILILIKFFGRHKLVPTLRSGKVWQIWCFTMFLSILLPLSGNLTPSLCTTSYVHEGDKLSPFLHYWN
jgi:hypothetical protein